MREKLTGGPAFPGLPEGWNADGTVRAYGGMDLRDYFAAKALTAIIGKCGAYDAINESKTHKSVSKIAYEMADAMLEVRGGA